MLTPVSFKRAISSKQASINEEWLETQAEKNGLHVWTQTRKYHFQRGNDTGNVRRKVYMLTLDYNDRIIKNICSLRTICEWLYTITNISV